MNNTETPEPQKSALKTVALGAIVLAAATASLWLGSTGTHKPVAPCCSKAETLQDPKQVDPKLIKYSELQSIKTELTSPRGIALGPAGKLFVAGDREIRVFSADGKEVSSIKLNIEPRCLTIADDGNIYIGAKDHVEVYDLNGAQKSAWPGYGEKAFITSLAAKGENVWVADAGQRAIYHCNTTGKMINTFGKRDASKNVPGLIIPSPHLEVVAAENGMVWATNPGRHRMDLYDSNGSIKRYWGNVSFAVEGFCGCCNPTDFAILPDGGFVTSEKGIPRVKVYTAKGQFDCVVASPSAFAENTSGIDLAVDAKGRIFVLDPAAKTVRVFTRKQEAKH